MRIIALLAAFAVVAAAGHCASDDTEPQLYRYKEECEDACINPPPANLESPKEDMDQTYGTVGELPTDAKESTTTQASSTSTETTTTTQV
ncbi:unnamed protein product [Nippostrongylus brasiliensis]|uniref:Secreted protein n=1 Tax=Nippostrongylus brasiliensis TaxID=27835 RepID=A0A0N4XFS3_NIPBR|nr:unnamed protein product [Nippostrongylus brasiliensis]